MTAPVEAGLPQERPPAEVPSQQEQATQTTDRLYVYKEEDLVVLLVTYEHLVEQEKTARMERVPHEPSLQYARRLLREGKQLSRSLPVSRPLDNPPPFWDHAGEKSWVSYENIKRKKVKDIDTKAMAKDLLRHLR